MKKPFNIKKFCIQQLQRSDKEITLFIDAARFKLGMVKQLNNAVKNDIDRLRIDAKMREFK